MYENQQQSYNLVPYIAARWIGAVKTRIKFLKRFIARDISATYSFFTAIERTMSSRQSLQPRIRNRHNRIVEKYRRV